MAEAAGVQIETVHLEDDHPYRAIQGAVRQRGCDAIAMASYAAAWRSRAIRPSTRSTAKRYVS